MDVPLGNKTSRQLREGAWGQTVKDHKILGPFVGFTEAHSAKIWVHLCDALPDLTLPLTISLHRGAGDQKSLQSQTLSLTWKSHHAATAEFQGLEPDQLYFYNLWWDEAQTIAVNLDGLESSDLRFQTLPEPKPYDRLDFILMSCHNPEKMKDDKYDGFRVWARLPDILKENENKGSSKIRFAVLGGDQIYGDEIEKAVLKAKDADVRERLYLSIYKKFWDNLHYRKVLCSLPSVCMWDDHDATDGHGSREDSFIGKTDAFKPQWVALSKAASAVFGDMQAQRNPPPLSQDAFDSCFRLNTMGFVLADLRTNRNSRKGRLWLPEQFERIKAWVDQQHGMEVLFFVSPVVFSHGDPESEKKIKGFWPKVVRFFRFFKKIPGLRWIHKKFDEKLGDLTDDINDSWGADINAAETERVLEWLFGLQNPSNGGMGIKTVILSGDIHTGGYSAIYSVAPCHTNRAFIPHIVSSPVSYEPFHWLGEAYFRSKQKVIQLGNSGAFQAQISHHHCHRNVVVVSVRNFKGDEQHKMIEQHLKVKYYLEGFPEPTIITFDLNRASHREQIAWDDSPEHRIALPVGSAGKNNI